jgi:hypothetical protein
MSIEVCTNHKFSKKESICNSCNKLSNELILCKNTNSTYCVKCSIECFNCDEYTCKNCIKQCKKCKQFLCLECIDKTICWSCINRQEAFNKQCNICKIQLDEKLHRCFNCGLRICKLCSNNHDNNIYCKNCDNY